MFKLFGAHNNKDKVWNFTGGIPLPDMKLQSSTVPIRTASLPEHFIVPLRQHAGSPAEIRVNVGQSVLKGQPLTAIHDDNLPVHSPTSGIISTIGAHIIAHPSGLAEQCVQITADGKDTWYQRYPQIDYQQLSAQQLLERIHHAGIAGLGGAGFPSATKLTSALENNHTLIINAAECEPYITADDRLIQEHADEIVVGIRILLHILQPMQVLIGIEDNKVAAIAALKQALSKEEATQLQSMQLQTGKLQTAQPPMTQPQNIQLRVIPTKYPSGGAKQLTKILTGMEIPRGKHSSSIGVLMQNIATVVAIKRAIIDGEPLIERVVTLTGDALTSPGNFWVRLGTPVRHLLAQAGFQAQPRPILIMGGPLMGFTLPSQDVPIVKISNCILAPDTTEIALSEPEQPCIRCGICVDACPAGLLPQQLYWFSRGAEHEKARDHNLFDCIECGACAYVCPSHIPLVQYYRQEKAEIQALDQEMSRAAAAKTRFEAKKTRLDREKQARAQRQPATKATVVTTQSPPLVANSLLIGTAATPQTSVEPKTENTTEQADVRQATIAAAIARVKAKKAVQILKSD
ncbi:electron transport complex subunit RsxC [Candidatus Fukatsuia symbiotica]|uniref:Ion-translocating oxidoreductase complex subunit C n=1 Tax=Candidatus Fukatsuia symbiotica TaxID=1878942 RepID=A0A2U8I5D3_9GAMM|nr:electron transport complex subunit RsxC [Candidatus Fukatsuia symbiotica]AWK14330.1 electron transport complex subunit RsxC [Candidatus Fukatsuia symbiotica]MEA9444591.1 electron transport complex subunit RsxC [Candidatus Fukatsuia symbiotica]